MDIYEYLKLDHESVIHLFEQFNHSDDRMRKQQIMELIAQELLIHARAEQATFYKALAHHFKTKQAAVYGKEEHAEIEAQIAEILKTKNYGSQWEERVKKLQEQVAHHVKEEEGPIFRTAKEVLTEDEAYRLKEKMHYLKQQLLPKIKKQYALAA